ncbi:amino acid adenylation domain-containing protein [Gemmata sp. JC717]|uniref:non-ribosomal peptide synthetase n=1 Tax=Gemmata algarum TaxID=2975278 RepID=UPI0021BB5373|nr:non-ribosomal peptide synthetase [Gemmata algarum]MDY3554423.1 amino acid adenylation domain-containing protein [Gemmata algarum]
MRRLRDRRAQADATGRANTDETPSAVISPHSLTGPRPSAGSGTNPRLLHEFFTRAARLWPGNVAIDAPPCPARSARRTVTYAELDRRSDAVAARLREFVAGECVVAVALPRNSEHVYLAQLAVLKAGAAYVCLDPAFPDAQLGIILGDARPVAVLTDGPGLARVRRLTSACALDATAAEYFGTHTPPAPAPWLTPESLAYLIYTSGTTGRPKGVMVEHRAIANLVRGDLATFPAAPGDRVAQSSSCAYDSSVEEVWMALAAGATLVVMDDDATRLGPDLVPWLRDESVTVFCPPPTLLRATGCERPDRDLPELARIHVGGEPLPQDIADRWAPGRLLVNDYGPTECAVVALRGAVGAGDNIHIGTPVPGIRAWVLNERLEEVPDGETGELCLSGAGLARGYLNDPELTARKFPVHPRLGRIYRTGDLAHRTADGTYVCHGRIDSQVKVRGYRIELEAIESRLAACPGVRAAACRVQGEGPQQQIAAFIVPADPASVPPFDALKEALRAQLPGYMVPAHFGLLSALPVSVSGKLNRRALPELAAHAPEAHKRVVEPRDPTEQLIADAARRVLGLTERVSVDHDFFHDLGGDSLRAAMLVSALRDDPLTAGLAVRDLYEARTVEGLARRARQAPPPAPDAPAPAAPAPRAHPFFATVVQTLWLLLGVFTVGPLVYLLAFHIVPDATERLGLTPFLLTAPLLYAAGVALYAAGSVLFAAAVKWLLIGRYRPTRAPIWGGFYVRNWIVQQTARLIPWSFLDGTVFTGAVLRLLGAKVGRGVHIQKGVALVHGGWDLLEIGDNVSIARDATLRLVDLEDGQIVVGPVAIGSGATLDIRSGMAPHTRLGENAYLAAQAYLVPGAAVPAGETWAGVPAAPAGPAPDAPPLPAGARGLAPVAHGLLLCGAKLALAAFTLLPLALAAVAYSWAAGIDTSAATGWLLHPTLGPDELLVGVALSVLSVPALLVSRCLSMRAMGAIPEGVVSRWSVTYARVLLKRDTLDWANDWLNGTLLWRAWLRGAGMTIGRDTEVSTIFDTVPELVELGPGTFFADGIYLGAPRVHRGTVTLARTTLGSGVFLGNYAVVPAGQNVPDGVLLGVCTVADDRVMTAGTSWFGVPPFELPRREIVAADAGLTHRPSRVRYVNRVFWELLRFTLPVAPLLLVVTWFAALEAAQPHVSPEALVFGVVPALDLAFLVALPLFGLALKWALLGRVRPATRGLWSCWCSRWDFNYIAWHYLALAPMQALEGTILLNYYLRALGAKVGRGVVIGDVFACVVDPDMLEMRDGATVSCLFQAHTFEDRVLKMDRVVIGAGASVGVGAVLLYGCHVGAGARVAGHSVVMKRERLLPNRAYAGCPTVAG